MWIAGEARLTTRLGVRLMPDLTYEWMMPRVLWGGLWGLLFMLPLLPRRSIYLRGFLLSLVPTLAQLFYFFPLTSRGMLGLSFGQLTPLYVLFFNAIWGLTAAWWVKTSGLH